jgi:hypothetical protein
MPKFQRRHYEVIAEIFAEDDRQSPLFDSEERLRLAMKFAQVFTRDNPRFDRARFLFACGVPEDPTLPTVKTRQ